VTTPIPNEPQPMGGVQSSPAFQNRVQSFGTGQNGDQGEAPAPVGAAPAAVPTSFLQRQQAMNSGGPARVRLTGSGNGMSSGQSQATMGGMLKPQNGIASDSYNNMKWQSQ
jgi:hypothetical protein